MTEERKRELEAKCLQFRKELIDLLHEIQTGHPGGSLSCAEILTTLYFDCMNHDPKHPKMEGRDRLILSKGHAAPMLYLVLAELGYFPKEELKTLRQLNSRLQGHPCAHKTPGVELSTGPLGLGLGAGVGMALAERLKNTPTEYGIRFVATSGEEEGKLGAENLLKRMSDTEKKNTLLVINLDNLIVGDKLYFNSGVKTPEAVRKLTRDRALAIARSHGIAATTNPGLNKNYPKGTGCCNDAEIFDKAGIAVLSVEATNWNLGNKDGYQQRAKTAAFPAGNSWHDVRLDNQQHIDKALPGRIERRCRDVMRIMLPLVKELAKAS